MSQSHKIRRSLGLFINFFLPFLSILSSDEEKLTADSCLCDACYRHVDRRANCPSYKKRLSAPASLAIQQARQQQQQQQELDQQQDDSMEVDDQGQQQQGNKAGGDPKRNRANGHNCSLCRSKMSKNRSFPLNQVREITREILLFNFFG